MSMSARAQAMILLKAAVDAGATDEAMEILQTGSLRRDGDASVDWPSALIKLEHLVATLSTDIRDALASSVEVIEVGSEVHPSRAA